MALGRRTRRLLIVALVLVAVLVALVFLARQQVVGDWPEGEVPAVEVPPSPFPAAPESVAALQRAVEAGEAMGDPDPDGLLAKDALPDAPPAAGWPRHPEAEAAFDALAALEGFALPDPDLREKGFGFLALSRVCKLRVLRAVERFLADDGEGAARDLAAVIHVGHRVQHGGGALVGAVVGLAIEDMALAAAAEMMASEREARRALPAALAAPLDAGLALPSATIRGLAGEGAMQDRLFEDFGKMSAGQLLSMSGDSAEIPEPDGGMGAPRWLYDPDRTRALARHRLHGLVEAARQPPTERRLPAYESVWRREWTAVGQYVDNPVGRILLEIATPAFDRYLTKEDALRQRRGRLRAELAVAAWRAEHEGAAPPSLEALVPAHLPAVPPDPFTGKPFGYEPTTGAVVAAAIPEH